MENQILSSLPFLECLETCTTNFIATIDTICDNMCNLYDKILSIKPPKKYNYVEEVKKITRSHSDSKIKYSDINNPDAWEMLQIRLV
jgi:hypothetical protein